MRAPIKGYINREYPKGHVTQWYGENPDLYAFLNLDGHNGVDVVAPYGTPILAVTTQTIVDVKYTHDGYGTYIKAVDDQYEYTYGHLSRVDEVSVIGAIVEAGTKIGEMGNSGFVVSGATPFWESNPYAGTHLHFSMRKLKPSGKVWVTYPTGRYYLANYYNGFKGAVDPYDMLEEASKAELTSSVKTLSLTVISLANQIISALMDKLNKRGE
jgi:murein DD-endopeptidase MepM/ murein hydrolase activator NlpD